MPSKTVTYIKMIKEDGEMVLQYVDPKTLKVNKYSRELFPELKGDGYELLKQDILDHGIRTPLEITKDGLILCGHERQRIALELGLDRVPVIYFSGDDVSQMTRIIKDNLARKAVDFRTKIKCYNELRRLYGLKHSGQPSKSIRSPERISLSEDEIAKEVGFSRRTLRTKERF